MGSEFDVFARYYDLDYGNFREDVDFYVNFARRFGGPILEVGCGTGRLVLALAAAGLDVLGVDVSDAMLGVAQAKVSARPDLAHRARLVTGDARDLELGVEIGVAIVAVNSFMHFVEASDVTRVLESLHRTIRAGGALILDLFNPDPDMLAAPPGLVRLEWTRVDPQTGLLVQKLVAQRADSARQLIEVTFLYDEIGAGGSVRRLVAPFTMRYWWHTELALTLERSGFRCERVYGSYELDEYGPESDRLIVVAARV